MEEMTQKEVDKLLARMTKAEAKLAKALKDRASERKALEADRYANLSVGAVDALLQEGIINKDTVITVNKLKAQLAGVEAIVLNDKNKQKIEDTKALLRGLLEMKSKEIGASLARSRAENDARREAARSSAEAYYTKWIAELERIIREVRENPLAVQTLAEREHAARESVEKDRMKALNEKLDELSPEMRRVDSHMNNAFIRLEQVTGVPDIRKSLVDAELSGNKGQLKRLVSDLQKKLYNAVLYGKDEGTLRSTAEVIPWERGGKDYDVAIKLISQASSVETLRSGREAGIKRAIAMENQRPFLLAADSVLHELFGPKRYKDGSPSFWDLIPNRDRLRAADAARAKAETAKTKAETARAEEEKRKQEAFDAKAREMIGRKDPEVGFEVRVPIYSDIRGKRVLDGEKRGVVVLEKVTLPNNLKQYTWRVKETFGLPDSAELKAGTVFKTNAMVEAKPWLRKAMDGVFKVENGRYVDRLPEAPAADKKG